MNKGVWTIFAVVGLGAAGLGLARIGERSGIPIDMGGAGTLSDSSGERMLDAYVALMNDEVLVDEGKLGIARVPVPPGTSHSRGPELPISTPASDMVKELRREIVKSGGQIGDGFIRTRPAPRGAAVGYAAIWTQFHGATNPAYELRAREAFNKATREATQQIGKNPSALFVKQIGTSTMMAKAIPFQSKTCLGCHRDAKVGDTAAIAAVVIRPSPPAQADIVRRAHAHGFDRSTERVFGLPTYPGAICPDEPSFSGDGGVQFEGVYRTKDAPQKVVAYYEGLVRSKPDAYISITTRSGSTFLRYEFGEVYYGSIVVGKGASISYTLSRFVRPGDLGVP